MKTLGVIFIIVGIFLTIMGYEQYANTRCECPAQIVGKPFNCHCEESLQQNIGHIVTYVGFAITGTGIILFLLGWRRQNSLVGLGK